MSRAPTNLASSAACDGAWVGRLDSPKLGQDAASKKFDRSRVVRVGGADDHVLDAGLGQAAEPLGRSGPSILTIAFWQLLASRFAV